MPAGHAAGHAAASWTAAEETAVSAVREHTPCGHVLLILKILAVLQLRFRQGIRTEDQGRCGTRMETPGHSDLAFAAGQ